MVQSGQASRAGQANPHRHDPGGRAPLAEPYCVSFDQKEDLQRQVHRFEKFAKTQGWKDYQIVTEMGSELNGKRKKLLRVLKDPALSIVIGWPSSGLR